MGTSGSATERGRETVFNAVEVHREGFNRDRLRDRASLHVIVISDENDSTSEAAVPIVEFAEYLSTLEFSTGMTTFNSIVNPSDCGINCGGGTPGDAYLRLTRHVGGIDWDIRRGNWDELLDLPGVQAAGLKREFFMSQLPDLDTLEIWTVFDGHRTDLYREGD